MKTCGLTVDVAMTHVPELPGVKRHVQLFISKARAGSYWGPDDGWCLSFDMKRILGPHLNHLTTLARQVWDEANGGSDG